MGAENLAGVGHYIEEWEPLYLETIIEEEDEEKDEDQTRKKEEVAVVQTEVGTLSLPRCLLSSALSSGTKSTCSIVHTPVAKL